MSAGADSEILWAQALQQTMEYIGITDEMSAEAMARYRPKYLDDVKGGMA